MSAPQHLAEYGYEARRDDVFGFPYDPAHRGVSLEDVAA